MKTLPTLRRTFLLSVILSAALAARTGVPAYGQNVGAPEFSNFQNTPVTSILDVYEQLSGKRLIRDTNLASVPPVSINAAGLSQDDMLKMIEATLLLNGVALIPVDDHTTKVITVGTNKNPRSEGLNVFASASELPADDEVVSYYMPLNYISAQEAKAIFTDNVPEHAYGAYTMAPSAQALVLTENASVIRQLIKLKELIDVPPAKVDTEYVPLNRADAEKTADLMNKLLNPKDKGDTGSNAAAAPGTGPANPVIVPPELGNDKPLSNERSLLSGSVQIEADPRSNELVIITRPVNMPYLRKMIDRLDRADAFAVPRVRQLHYVLAQNILPGLEAAVAQGKEEQEQAQGSASGAPGASSGSATNQVQNPTPPVPNNNTNPGGNYGGGGSGNVTAITPPLQSPTENDVPTVVTIGRTRIMADNRSNSILIYGSGDAVERVFSMIDVLDRKPLQVYLATVIGELTVNNDTDFGVDLLQKFHHGIGTSSLTPNTVSGGSALIPEPSSLITSTGFPLLSGLNIYGAIGNTLDAYVRALETTSNLKVISRPSVYTTNNKLAVIASGSQVPVPSNTTSGFTGGNTLATTSSITYEDVLLQLDIIPLINASNQVTLKIRQTNNSLGPNTLISGNEIPTILTQEINTEVTVPNKSTIMIGGLISDTKQRTTSGVPWLSDIPGLGYLFKDTDRQKQRQELIIMIQPTVIDTDADQFAANEGEKRRTSLGPDVDAATALPQVSPALAPVMKDSVFPAPVDTKDIPATRVQAPVGNDAP